MIYSIVSSVIFVIVTIYFGMILVNLIRRRGCERTDYIRNFKLGDGFYVYCLTIPVYYLGLLYDGRDWLISVFMAIGQGIKTVVLDFQYGDIEALLMDNIVYKVTAICCFIACCMNTALLLVSILSQYIFAGFTRLRWIGTRKSRVMIIGNNPGSRKIYETVKKGYAVLAGELDSGETGDLYAARIKYLLLHDVEKEISKVLNKSFKSKKRIDIIVNTENDEQNIRILGFISECLINEYEKESLNKEDYSFMLDVFSRIRVIGLKNPAYDEAYENVESEGFGCIRCISKFELVADNFLMKNPLPIFLKGNMLDTDAATVSDEGNISIEFFGMDTYNEELLLNALMEYQFPVKKADGEVRVKEITYHAFDEHGFNNCSRIQQGILRFQNNFLKKDRKEEYLEFPDAPGKIVCHEVNLHSEAMLDSLADIHKDKNHFTFAIVSVGSDIDNLTFAKKLKDFALQNNWENYNVFARVKDEANNGFLVNDNSTHPFGNENRLIYDYEVLKAQKLTVMAMMRNRDYVKTRGNDAFLADYFWYTRIASLERKSNENCVKNLRFKLNLLGLDLVEKSSINHGSKPCTKNEYLAAYSKARDTLACQEHFRWNAFYLCNGYLPATKEAIINEEKNGKDAVRKTHGNLTTMNGLVEFRKIISERDSKDEMDCDVIKYDYDIMDGAYEYLDSCGYMIVFI